MSLLSQPLGLRGLAKRMATQTSTSSLSTGFKTRLSAILLVVFFPMCSFCVNCYDGVVTTGDSVSAANDVSSFSTSACNQVKGSAFDTCAIFCSKYQMLKSNQGVYTCSRFCMNATEERL
mmetsp:Transcript_49693/g.155508  ORF Transcript_49693/g.155508 Transcript_49693/m.155508 type:complete len:120 (-) Transcript_49693:254-613(-)